MSKLTLSTIGSRYASVAALNANFAAIVTAIENTLSRDGTSPNTMSASLDMNSNRIINAGDAVTNQDVPTLRQLNAIIASASLEHSVGLCETQTATGGQTVFTLLGISYNPGSNNLAVYVNGLRLHPTDYTETSSTVVTMASGLSLNDEVVFYTNEELILTDPVVIGGGTINGTTIGNTTPAAGHFTTLTATAFDINGGTIDGTVIGGSTPAAGSFTTLSASGVATFSAGSAAAPSITTSGDTNNGIFFPAADVTAITTAGSERLRIDSSGNVGIGTSSPSVKLEVNRGSAGSIATFTDGVSTNFNFSTSGTVGTFGTEAGSTSLALKTSGAERMRIDSSGNVGIGTSSPSTYGTFAVQTQTTNAPTVAITGSSLSPQLNHYVNDSTAVLRNLNQIQFVTSSSDVSNYQGYMTFSTMGSAGGTISERMRIDATGNVGIGTGSPTAKLDVSSDVIRLRTAKTPASATATGNAGDIAWDSSYIYVCVATNTWKRVAIATW